MNPRTGSDFGPKIAPEIFEIFAGAILGVIHFALEIAPEIATEIASRIASRFLLRIASRFLLRIASIAPANRFATVIATVIAPVSR